MKLETKRLRIRNFREDEAETLYKIKYDINVLKYNPDFIERDVTKERVRDLIGAYIEADQSETFDEKRVYAVELITTSQVVGVVTVGKNQMLQEYELGWKIITEYTCHGYASEAARALSEFVCKKQNVDYVIAVMDIDNPALAKEQNCD